MPIRQEITFIQEMERLKTITRQNQTLDNRFENSAEHSWQLAVMALVFKEHFPEAVDMEHVLSMLLLHDIGEIGAGDTSAFDEVGKATSYARERLSVEKSACLLPATTRQQVLELWEEFETGKSPEARFARCLDALAPLMNHLWIAKEGENPDDLTYSQVRAKKAFIQAESPALWELTVDLLEQSVAKGLYRDDREGQPCTSEG